MFQSIIGETLKISIERARLVEGYLRLQYGTLDHLSRDDIRREYDQGCISATIDQDPQAALSLADSFGL